MLTCNATGAFAEHGNFAASGYTLRVTLENGDVRQGRYVTHDARSLRLYDGLLRVISLSEIRDVRAVPTVPHGMCANDLEGSL